MSECPSPEMLTRPEAQEHLAVCSRCRTELAMLTRFEAAEPTAAELESLKWVETELRRRTSPPSAWRRFLAWIFSPAGRPVVALVAAALLIAIGASLYFRPGGVRPPDTVPVWRSGQFAALAPLGDVAVPPAEFRWEAVPGAASYRVEVSQVDGTPVWSADASSTTIAIPPAIAPQLVPARTFQWRVDARNAAGEKIASTDLQTFHITHTTR